MKLLGVAMETQW